ncbi:S-layer homology domain-containing protein [Paenibacillus ferrarius]|uniref:S-layer homology domain-containing protein n=1 Tax=Paenibacillus ferrarius TaxID=1469647 RepID=UPI003D28F14B
MLRTLRTTLAKVQVFSMLATTVFAGSAAAAEPAAVETAAESVPSMTAFTDTASHWASQEIDRWSQKGIINGYEDHSFKPDASVSRAEFISLITRVFGYSSLKSGAFADVSQGSWYADAIAKAAAAGIVTGDAEGQFRPGAPISRQEAAVVLYRAFDLQTRNPKAFEQFGDASAVAEWSKQAVSALFENGYVTGRMDGMFAPQSSVTRAEFVKMLDGITGELKNEAGTYTGNIQSNVVINTRDVNLKNMTIAGDLYITQGVGDGNISLDHVQVRGRTIVRGGGEHSIVINSSTLQGQLLVLKEDGKVRIVMQGDSSIPKVQLQSGALLETDSLTGSGFGDVQVAGTIAAGQDIMLDGHFSSISVEAPGVTVQVTDGSVDAITIQKSAVGSEVKIISGSVRELNVLSPTAIALTGGTVDNLKVQPSAAGTSVSMNDKANVTNFTANAQVAVKGSGHIENAVINADGVTMEPQPLHVTVSDGVKTDVKPPSSGGGSGGSSGGSSGGDQPPQSGQTAAQVAGAITSITAPMQDAVSLTLPSVPAGFTVAIKSSSDTGVIALNGTIVPPTSATVVNLVLEVTRTSDGSKASTSSLSVTVPAKSVIADGTGIRLKDMNYNYISDISANSLTIATGNTYIYTVDTAEGAGLTTMTLNTVGEMLDQLTSATDVPQTYTVNGTSGSKTSSSALAQGDVLTVSAGGATRDYTINFAKGALRGKLELPVGQITANTPKDVTMNFFSGLRSPATTVALKIPKGINVTMDNTWVNVIGRGKVKLSGLETQSIGRTGDGYRFQKVGTVDLVNNSDGSQLLTLSGLDFRPANGADLELTFEGLSASLGTYTFEAAYTTAEPEVLTSPWVAVNLQAVETISDFRRVLDKSLTYKETSDTYTKATFTWSPAKHASSITLLQSADKGATWTTRNVSISSGAQENITLTGLTPNTEYYFKLAVVGGENAGDSNIAKFYTGKLDAKLMGAKGNGTADDTDAINDAIIYLNSLGGGTLLFTGGTFNVRTVHLQSNVYLYVNSDATISALKGGDAPETTYFSDKGYRSGTSATSTGPYKDPENYLTKQDVGHHYFRNAMFFGERLDNIKIIGNGRITGNGNISTSDGVMDNAANNRSDKMVTVKLCTNFEFGGLDNGLDLWYEETNSPTTDEPYYIQSIDPDGSNEVKQRDISNMLRVDRAGHFAMLATGTDHINTHDFYYGKDASGSARDVFDYMQSSYVTAKNIYVRGSSDDIVKPGSDASLGFTRPATDFWVRNIIGDTNCNLFQIGSETVDDIKNAYVDNIYVLAGNKAGFSISTNDGAHVENIYLNYGMTGTVHHKAQMRRTRAPFFISISNRGRTIGGNATRMKWMENGVQRDELLSTNVNIGQVKNIYIKDVNIEQVYQGSSYSDPTKRWKSYSGAANTKATPIIAGYKVGDGGPVLPDGRNIGYIENLNFENVDVLVKGGNSFADTLLSPPELGVGKYNIGDIGEQPSYGFWAKHVKGLTFKNVNMNFEQNDDRYAIVLDDVANATLDGMKMVAGTGNPNVVQLRGSSHVTVTNSAYYSNTWGNALTPLANLNDVTVTGKQTYPNPTIVNLKNTDIQLKASGHANLTALDVTLSTITAALGSVVSDIVSQVESTNATNQSYAVTDASHAPKVSGQLVTGDVLVVTSEDGTTTKSYAILVPNVITAEAEDQKDTAVKSAGVTLSTSTTNGSAYLQTNAVAIGDYVELTINVPVAGTYDLSYQYKTATSGRATAQVSLDGTNIGSPTSQLGATANVFVPVDLGNVTLSAGNHTVRFTATVGGSIVIDYVRLTGEASGPAAPSTNTNIQLAASHPNVIAVDNSAKTVNVSSGATVAQITSQVGSTDGSTQVYTVTDAGHVDKSLGALVTGDILVVKAEMEPQRHSTRLALQQRLQAAIQVFNRQRATPM